MRSGRSRVQGLRPLVLALLVLAACEAIWPGTTKEASIGPGAAEAEAEGELLRRLFDPGRGVDREVVRAIRDSGRREFAPVLIELLRFRDGQGVGIPEALEKLTGRRFADDWSAWVEWLGDQDISARHGFDAWKAELFAGIDPRFRLFLYAGVPTRIKLEEIVWGGVVKDGIPALVNPEFVAASAATYLQDAELVFGVALNGDERAYPHRILDWHEMANDAVGDIPIAVAY